jgi:hypothetical protein
VGLGGAGSFACHVEEKHTFPRTYRRIFLKRLYHRCELPICRLLCVGSTRPYPFKTGASPAPPRAPGKSGATRSLLVRDIGQYIIDATCVYGSTDTSKARVCVDGPRRRAPSGMGRRGGSYVQIDEAVHQRGPGRVSQYRGVFLMQTIDTGPSTPVSAQSQSACIVCGPGHPNGSADQVRSCFRRVGERALDARGRLAGFSPKPRSRRATAASARTRGRPFCHPPEQAPDSRANE